MSIPAYGAPEIRYSDRDVREDESLLNLAVAYVDVYGGDFEPLVAGKRELAQTGTLSTRTARVVLNCMRYDVNVSASLPAPQSPSLVRPAKRRRRDMFDMDNPVQCGDTNSHGAHWWRPSGECLHTPNPVAESVYCEGVPWAINRGVYYLPARVKKPFVHGRGATSLLHRTTGEGSLRWLPRLHEYGFLGTPELRVRTACVNTTRTLINPVLLSKIPEGKLDWHARCTQGCFDA